MNILLIGGTRFFGKRFAAQALAAGHSLTIVSRGRTADPFGDAVQRIVCNRRQLAEHLAGSRHFDVVVDQIAFDATDAATLMPVLTDHAARYIVTSSQSVYDAGGSLREGMYDPSAYSFTTEADKHVDYSEAKRQMESVVAHHSTIPWTTVRFPMVVAEDDYTKRLEWHVERVRHAKDIYMPDPSARLSFIHATDAGAALLHLCTSSLTGPVNAAAPEPMAVGAIVERIATLVGKPAVWATEATEENHSPYGIDADWWMDTSRLAADGFRARSIPEWMDQLIGS